MTREYARHFGSAQIHSRDVAFDTTALPGLVAEIEQRPLGALSYTQPRAGQSCEVIALVAIEPNRGAGAALLSVMVEVARKSQVSRLFLTTSNDNLPALRFYQRLGWRIVAVHRDAITRARMVKPAIPLKGHADILICDELELEFSLEPGSAGSA